MFVATPMARSRQRASRPLPCLRAALALLLLFLLLLAVHAVAELRVEEVATPRVPSHTDHENERVADSVTATDGDGIADESSPATTTADHGNDDDADADDSRTVTVFMCADSGEFSGTHELAFLHDAMEERTTLPITHCVSAYLGYLRHADGHRIRALAVTTGIGYISATVCTRSVLRLQTDLRLRFASMVLIGTSGFSPFVGGFDPTNTSYYARYQAQQREAQAKLAEDTAEPPQEAATSTPKRYLTAREYRERKAAQAELVATRSPTGRIVQSVNYERADTQEQLDADGCAPRSPDTQKVAVGSICVTSGAFLMESAQCTETRNSNQCSRPNCHGFDAFFGAKNSFLGDDTLARKIEAASEGKAFPAMPEHVRKGMQTFWDANEAAGGDRAAPSAPMFVRCAESTLNAIVVGAERDYLCRELTARVLQGGVRGRRDEGTEKPTTTTITADNVVCVQAMEAFGFLQAIHAAAPDMPHAVIRTASNYDMYPLQKQYVSSEEVEALIQRSSAEGKGGKEATLHGVGPETAAAAPAAAKGITEEEATADAAVVAGYVWRQNVDYISQEEYDAFVISSFHYSVKTVTFVLSNYFLGGRDLSSSEVKNE